MYFRGRVHVLRLPLSLLVKISLNTTLGSFAGIVLSFSPGLLLAVASKACDSSTNATSDAVRDALAEIADLALSFLTLSFLVLADALLLQTFGADKVSNHLFARTDGLVPGTFLTVGVVLGHARGGDTVASNAGTCVRNFLFGISLGLLVLSCGLRKCQ